MTHTDDLWIPTSLAVERIRVRLNVSVGRAHKILSEAWASGEVRRSIAVGSVQPSRTDETGVVEPEKDISWADLDIWLNVHYRIKAKNERRGRGPAIEIETYKEVFRLEVEKRGWPELTNDDPSWRLQADVERFILDLARDRSEEIKESAARTYAKELLGKRSEFNF